MGICDVNDIFRTYLYIFSIFYDKHVLFAKRENNGAFLF